ncbi:F1F0-ATPase inhibitor protein [Parasponia andersonii]|uniref:F1F0-ATPase inhibitor protein n=1 Tax=Parasponia andersonii TaxID=3476 RepID=A0A2P5DAJ0_PARAD|nr:F1F0-ATPase inhibitor protein [Parasponia andersonii]
MAMRSALRLTGLTRSMETTRAATRYFSDGKGKILSEEERAAENIYIQKMERERLEKLKKKAEKEKAEKEKEHADKTGTDVVFLSMID